MTKERPQQKPPTEAMAFSMLALIRSMSSICRRTRARQPPGRAPARDAATHIDPEVLGDPAAVLPQHAKGHALLQEDAQLVAVLELHLQEEQRVKASHHRSVPRQDASVQGLLLGYQLGQRTDVGRVDVQALHHHKLPGHSGFAGILEETEMLMATARGSAPGRRTTVDTHTHTHTPPVKEEPPRSPRRPLKAQPAPGPCTDQHPDRTRDQGQLHHTEKDMGEEEEEEPCGLPAPAPSGASPDHQSHCA